MADVVRGQIAYPEAPMPANLVEGSDADDVAVYVAKCAANPACGVTAATHDPAGDDHDPDDHVRRRLADRGRASRSSPRPAAAAATR